VHLKDLLNLRIGEAREVRLQLGRQLRLPDHVRGRKV
jgi:hypothetical protein